MVDGISANRLELLQIADSVAREKAIDKTIVIEAIQNAMEKAAKNRYGAHNDIRVHINPDTGESRLERVLTVVEEVEDDNTEISLKEAQTRQANIDIGGEIVEELPSLPFGRIATQSAKQVIFQKLRDAERSRQYEEFKDRGGEIINGQVRRIEYGNVIVDLGRAEGMLRRDQQIPREAFRIGDRVRSFVQSVSREQRGPQILLSRTDTEFMRQLFTQEVPEVYEGSVEIKSVARDPGSRAKIAVLSHNTSIDPVGACVGMRGSRVQAVVNELQGEKVDIILWSLEPATFIVNALAPAEVTKVLLDEDTQKIEVVVPDDQLSLAIGRRGQNVRLASQLTQWDIDITTESEASKRRQEEFAERTKNFMEALDVDEMLAQLLTTEGFESVEEVAMVPLSEITDIEGFDTEAAEEIQQRAQEFIEQQNAAYQAERKKMGVSDAIADLEGLSPAMLAALGKANILKIDDLAGCVPDDLLGWTERKNRQRVYHDGILESFGLNVASATTIIMNARVAAGWVTQEELEKKQAQEAAEAQQRKEEEDRAKAPAPEAPLSPAEPPAESLSDARAQADAAFAEQQKSQ